MSPQSKHSISKVLGKYIALGNQQFNIWVRFIPSTWAFALGAIFLPASIGITFLVECPSFELVRGLRMTFSIALALLATGIIGSKGNASASSKGDHKLLVQWRGTITVGIFVLTYFFTPPSLIAKNPCADGLIIQGRVLLGHEPMPNAVVRIPSVHLEDRTNSLGEFYLPIATDDAVHPLKLMIEYPGNDTSFNVNPHDLPEKLVINLPDTLVALTPELIQSAIDNHLTQLQKWINDEHQIRLQNGGHSSSLKEIIQAYRPYEQRQPGGDNFIFYHRSTETLDSQTSIKKAGVPIKPFAPYDEHFLQRYRAFIWNPVAPKKSTSNYFSLQYAMVNLAPLSFKIDHQEKVSKTKHQITVTYQNPVRLIHAKLEFGDTPQQFKKRKIRHYGVFPREQHTLIFQDGIWQWAGVKRIDKPLGI